MSILFFIVSGLMFALALNWMIASSRLSDGEGMALSINTLIASGIFSIAGTLA